MIKSLLSCSFLTFALIGTTANSATANKATSEKPKATAATPTTGTNPGTGETKMAGAPKASGAAKALGPDSGYYGLSFGEPMMKKLGFTEEQKKQLQALRAEAPKKNNGLWKKLAEKRQDMWTAVRQGNDSVVISLIYKEIQKIENEIEWNRFEAHLKARDLMTPTQLASFKKIRAGGAQKPKK